MKLNRAQRKYLVLTIKLVILAVIGAVLVNKFYREQDIWIEIKELFGASVFFHWWLYVIVIFLMPVNWFIEAVKWKILAKSADLSLKDAIKGVLAGLTLGFATPHAFGDYAGRIYSTSSANKKSLVGAVFVSRTSQMLPTLVLGSYGLAFLFGREPLPSYLIKLAIGSVFVAALMFVLIKFQPYFRKYFRLLREYKYTTYLVVILLALLRYVVFCSQFVIVIYTYLPTISIEKNIAGTTFIFLSKSIIPSLNFLSDLGVREFSTIYFFENVGEPIVPVLCASLKIWIINILIPTLIGIPAMLKIKLDQ